MKKLITALIILISFIGMSKANDVEALAKYVQVNLSKNLPQKISQNMTLTEVIAINDMVMLNALLSYDREFLENKLNSVGNTMQNFKYHFPQVVKKGVCTNEALLKFVRMGGKINYRYSFSDGENFLTIRIRRCQ